jgi:hypothetical protein
MLRPFGIALLAVFIAFIGVPPPASASSTLTCEASSAPGLCLDLSPDHASVGTKVVLRARITSHQLGWSQDLRHPAYFTLMRDFPKCELLVELSKAFVRVDPDTQRVYGSFIVGDRGSCFQPRPNEPRHHSVSPGQYALVIGAHTSFVADFTVTRGDGIERKGLPQTGNAVSKLTVMGWFGIVLILVGAALKRSSARWRPGDLNWQF